MTHYHFLLLAGTTLFFSSAAAFFYYHKYGKRDIAISVIAYSILVFCIVYFVSFENNLGLGIGLLGILSLVRLRSTPENPIDIGFIFFSITIGLLNASIDNISTIVVSNTVLLGVITLLSSGLFFQRDTMKTEIVFDNLDAENLENKKNLFKKIQKQYKVTPVKIRIKSINYLKDSISIIVTYNAKDC